MALVEIERVSHEGAAKDSRVARLAARARGDRTDRRQSAAHPAHAIEEIARDAGEIDALISRARNADLSRACRTRQSLCALGARPEPRQRRDRLPDDAEPAGIFRHLARHHLRRRRRLADQYAIARPLAGPLHRHRRAEARHRRRRTDRTVPLRDALAAGRKYGRMAAATSHASIARSSGFQPAPLSAMRAPRRLHLRSRADDLHLRHDRNAEGRQCQPSPADAMEFLVRRPDRYRAGRPHV